MKEIVFKEESYAIIGACFEVYNEKGCGFLEPVYQESLQIEFEYKRLPAIAKPARTLSYRRRTLLQTYQADFGWHGKIIVELKAASALADEHRAQLLNYLHATGFQMGLRVNFGHHPRLEYERIAMTEKKRNMTISLSDSFAVIRVVRGPSQ